MAVVREDPYRLSAEVYGIGFLSADRIAAALGLPPDAPQRARAGLLHALAAAADQGHVYLPRERLLAEAESLLGVGREPLEAALAALARAGEVAIAEPPPPPDGGRTVERAPRGDGDGFPAVYAKPLAVAEEGLASRLRALLDDRSPPPRIDAEKALAWFEKREKLGLAGQQREAIRRGLTSRVLVITGGPGTGKTTLVRGIVAILAAKGQEVLLAAPTGRAAKRLAEATGREAKTVHRLLEYNPLTRTFERGPDRPLEADLVILDEASMLDTALAYHAVKAMPPGGRLVLVGDVDQLPSVGPGRVLADLIDSGAVDVVRLTEIFRQAATSLIVRNAHRVNAGEMPDLGAGAARADADFYFIDRREPEAVVETVVHLVCDRIPQGFGFDPLEDIQVLTPMNRGPLGTETLNRLLRERLNPGPAPEVARGARSFRVGDKVMQIRNNYELDVFNGDLGRVAGIDAEDERVRLVFDGRTVHHEFASLDELTLAYACSIHKSQGSEYPCVVVPVHTTHWVMLQRNLLYTALTRAQKLVVLVGEARAIAVAVRNRKTRDRYTLLAERLAAGGGAAGRRAL
jgi:exodeoxyribonuclease V alpha subunit